MTKRLTIILGAGFSQPFKIPGTKSLTDLTRALPLPRLGAGASHPAVAAAALLYRALESEYEQVSFELALHAVETLLSYSASDHADPSLSAIHQVLRPFTIPKKRWADLVDFKRLRRLRAEFIRAIAQKLEGAERIALSHASASSGLKKSDALIHDLSATFGLRCFTLNYDTVIDQTLKWNDGFLSSAPYTFSRKEFNDQVASSKPLLCHLHGSIKFGFESRGRIAKFADPREAIESYSLEARLKPNQAGELNFVGPIVSGLRKLDKLTSTPYGYYYAAFVNEIIRSSRLLIIGYGFGDAHLDYWLAQHRTLHGRRRRVVLVKRATRVIKLIAAGDDPAIHVRTIPSSIRPKDGALSYKHHGKVSYYKSSELLAILSGYPLDEAGRAMVSDHLASVP